MENKEIVFEWSKGLGGSSAWVPNANLKVWQNWGGNYEWRLQFDTPDRGGLITASGVSCNEYEAKGCAVSAYYEAKRKWDTRMNLSGYYSQHEFPLSDGDVQRRALGDGIEKIGVMGSTGTLSERLESDHNQIVDFGGVTASKCPDFAQIPLEALISLADRFSLGEEKHGRDQWRAGLTNDSYVVARLSHTIYHCLKLIGKINGDLPWDTDDDAGAIMWGGAMACVAKGDKVLPRK